VPHQQTLIFGGQQTTRPFLAKQQRQYSATAKPTLKIHSFPYHLTTSPEPPPPPTAAYSKLTNFLDSPTIPATNEFRNQAESMLYSNATRMLQLRIKELDKVRDNTQFVYSYNPQSADSPSNHASYTPPPPAPPPPPPHKQEHLTSTPGSKFKPPVVRSHTTDNEQRLTYAEIEACRIKSYNEGASIFKINKIQDLAPELDKRRQQQQEFLRQKTLIAGEKADSRADSVGNSNTDKLVNKQKAAMEALSGGRNTPIISAGMYISSHLCPFAVRAQKIWGIFSSQDRNYLTPKIKQLANS
jgi:hypothetical protein